MPRKSTRDRARDAEIVAALVRGEPGVWQSFLDEFSSAIYGAILNTLRKSGRGADDSNDIAQDVFVRLCKNDNRLLKQFDSTRAGLKTWLGVIASSATIDYLRKLKGIGVGLDEIPEDLTAVAPTLHEPVNIPDGLLSDRQALVLRLLYDKDMDAAEVAQLLNIDPQTVRSTHHKALVKLRRYFAEENL